MSFKNAESEDIFIELRREKDKGCWPHELTGRVRDELDVETNLTIIKKMGFGLLPLLVAMIPAIYNRLGRDINPLGLILYHWQCFISCSLY